MAGKKKPSFIKVLIPIFGILVLVIGSLYLVKSQLGEHDHAGHINIGDQVEDFTLHRFGGGKTKLSALKKKIVLVNFWATWCEACVVEMPSILKLRERYLKKGFDVIFVNLDDNPDKVLPDFLKKFGINFDTYLDQNSRLTDMFEVYGIPLTVILDQNRKVLLIERGERDWDAKSVHSKMKKWLQATDKQ